MNDLFTLPKKLSFLPPGLGRLSLLSLSLSLVLSLPISLLGLIDIVATVGIAGALLVSNPPPNLLLSYANFSAGVPASLSSCLSGLFGVSPALESSICVSCTIFLGVANIALKAGMPLKPDTGTGGSALLGEGFLLAPGRVGESKAL